MSEKGNNNQTEELDMNHLMQIRRDKLAELQAEAAAARLSSIYLPEKAYLNAETTVTNLSTAGIILGHIFWLNNFYLYQFGEISSQATNAGKIFL